jgi:hypothetical protein
MNGMTTILIAALFALSFQDDDAARRAQETADRQQRAQEAAATREQVETRDKSIQSLRDFLTPTPNPMASRAVLRDREFHTKYAALREALLDAEAAEIELRDGISSNAKLKKAGQSIARSSKTFIDFLKLVDKRRVPLDASRLKAYSPDQLAPETLSSTKRAIPLMNEVIAMEDQENDAVDIQFLTKLPAIESELLRLQWLAQKLK